MLKIFNCLHNLQAKQNTHLALLWSLSVGRRSLRSWFLHPQLSRIPAPRSRFLAATWNQRRDLWAANSPPTDIHANRNMPLNENHTRGRKKRPLLLGWSMTKLLAAHVEGRCFEILDREFLATPRDFAPLYTLHFRSNVR